ncbi:MAG: NAD-dependent epimerase/dehydratase family protein [Deltaproteobacteria bacterium]|nr:NAD-dependent epimerase/dehydratase family protein [Deltaproteobacteria bacterium]
MKFLVTGGAGFIGSHVVDALLGHGYEVAVIDDLSTGKRENLNPQATFYNVDIVSTEVADIFAEERPHVVYHHAAQMDVRRAVREPQLDAMVNVVGSVNILECGRRSGVRKLIYASTGGAVYGEPAYLPVDEAHPLAPLSPYGLTKHAFESYLALYGRLYGVPYTVLRYPNVYGPRQNPHGEAGVVAIFIQRILAGDRPTIFGDGKKTRDYTYIDDVVAANLLVINRGDNRVYNVGWGREVSDCEIFSTVRDAVGATVEPRFDQKRPGEIDRICLDSRKIQGELGWQPRVSLQDGVRETVRWQKRATLHAMAAKTGNPQR